MDLGSLLDGKSNEQIAALEVEAASQMEDKLDGISNYEAVVGDCPVLFSFGNTTSTGRRSLLNSDDNKLTVTTDDDANGGAVRSFYVSPCSKWGPVGEKQGWVIRWVEDAISTSTEGVQLRGEVQCEASGCKVALRTREAKKSRKAGFAVYCVQFMHMMQRNLECEAQDMLGGACKTWPTVFNDWCNTCEEA
eukprot:1142184-Pelagomonas_calceolata.AAC.5